ncbi:hypothetical protein ABW21_db0204554 [Orbilia brochopaga]|nr:hypothetical protein ABW21_db0204554 [Drechslerella brochopaga]
MVEQVGFALRNEYSISDRQPPIPRGLDKKCIEHRHLCQHLGSKGLREISTFLVNKILDGTCGTKLHAESICNFALWDDVYSGMLRQWGYIEDRVPWSPVISVIQLASLFDSSYEVYIHTWRADASVLAIAENLQGSIYHDALERAKKWGDGDDVVLARYMTWLEGYDGWRGIRDGSPWVVYDYAGSGALPEYP